MNKDQLIASGQALLDLDAKGVLVPHGIGGHAREIIEGFIALARRTQPSAGEPWRCAKCDCHSYARVDRLSDSGKRAFEPGDLVRCVNCKDVSFFPATPPDQSRVERLEAVEAALTWAMDEIDILSNKLCQFGYPQGMSMLDRRNQLDNYRKAVDARRQALHGARS